MDYFREIDIPLSEQELKELAKLTQIERELKVPPRRRSQRRASKLAGEGWKRQASITASTCLNSSNSKLYARRDRPKALEDYQQMLEWRAFADLDNGLTKTLFGRFNLPAIIEQYEQGKAYCKSPVAIQEHARAALATIEQKKADFIKYFDRYNEFEVDCKNPPSTPGAENPPVDWRKQIILRSVRSELLNGYQQHVGNDLIILKQNTRNESTIASQVSLPQKRASKKKTAELRDLTLDTVKTIFTDAGLGPTSQPGEWAAALIALSVSGCLVGVPPEIHRWFTDCRFAGKTSVKTIDNKKQWTEPMQFPESERDIFKSVLRKTKKAALATIIT